MATHYDAHHPIEVSVDDARGGVTGHNVRYVLGFGLTGIFVAFAAIAVTFCFYVYVGVTGGITDGFDRFAGPSESVEQTLADPNYQPPLPPGAWTGIPDGF